MALADAAPPSPPAVVSASEANRSFSSLLRQVAQQPATGAPRSWKRDDLYD